VKISNKKFKFFSTRNQYSPHIPYVASKKRLNLFKAIIRGYSIIIFSVANTTTSQARVEFAHMTFGHSAMFIVLDPLGTSHAKANSGATTISS
jgi:hypothetical protein